ncbi:MAG: VOC family protein [Hyphomicrobium sp.]
MASSKERSKSSSKSPPRAAAKPKAAAKPASAPSKRGKVKPVPDGTRTVTPHLVCGGAANAIRFYEKAFGAVELMRLPAPDGKIMHACIRIGDTPVFLVDENTDYGMPGPKALKGSPVMLHLAVEDADAFVARAVAAGAKVTMPVTEMFWGDRYGQIEDPFGHLWSVATHVRDMTVEEIKAASRSMGR